MRAVYLHLFVQVQAFSGFGKINCRENNREVRQATELLQSKIQDFANDLRSSKTVFSDASNLVEILHDQGINCRHIAAIRCNILNSTKKNRAFLNTTVTEVLLTECVFRTLKVMLRTELRSATPDTASKVAARFLNNVFIQNEDVAGREDDSLKFVFQGLTGTHNTFWQIYVRMGLILKYGVAHLDENMRIVANGLSKHVLQLQLFQRLCSDATGVYIIPETRERWVKQFGIFGSLPDDALPLKASDIICLPEVEFAVTYRMLLRPLVKLRNASKLVTNSLSRKRGHSLILLSKLKDASELVRNNDLEQAYSILCDVLECLENALYCPFLFKVLVLFELGRLLRRQKKFDRSLIFLKRASKILELQCGVGVQYIQISNGMRNAGTTDRQARGHPFHVLVINEILGILNEMGRKSIHLDEYAELASKLFDSQVTFVPVWNKECSQEFSSILRVVFVRLYQIENKIDPDENVDMIDFFEKKFERVRHESSISKNLYTIKFRAHIDAVRDMFHLGLNCNTTFSTVYSSSFDLSHEKEKSKRLICKTPEIKDPSIVAWLHNRRVRASRTFGLKMLQMCRVVPPCAAQHVVLFLYYGFHEFMDLKTIPTITIQRVLTQSAMSMQTYNSCSVSILAFIGETDSSYDMIHGMSMSKDVAAQVEDFKDSMYTVRRTNYMMASNDEIPKEFAKLPKYVCIENRTHQLHDPIIFHQTSKEKTGEMKKTRIEWFDITDSCDFPLRYVDVDVRILASGGNTSTCTTTTNVEISSFHEIVNGIHCVKYEGTMKSYTLNTAYGSNTTFMPVKILKSFAFPGQIVNMETKNEIAQSRTISTIMMENVTLDERFQHTIEHFLHTKKDISDGSSRKKPLIDEIVEYLKIIAGCELPDSCIKTYYDTYIAMEISQLRLCCATMKNQAEEKQRQIAMQAEARSRGAGSDKAKLVKVLEDLTREMFHISSEMSNLACWNRTTSSDDDDDSRLKAVVSGFNYLSFQQLSDKIEEQKVQVSTMRKKLEALRTKMKPKKK